MANILESLRCVNSSQTVYLWTEIRHCEEQHSLTIFSNQKVLRIQQAMVTPFRKKTIKCLQYFINKDKNSQSGVKLNEKTRLSKCHIDTTLGSLDIVLWNLNKHQFRRKLTFDLTAKVTKWPILSWRAARCFFREALRQLGAKRQGGRTNPLPRRPRYEKGPRLARVNRAL